MTTMQTDQGTLQLLKQLTPSAVGRLNEHLANRASKQYSRIEFNAADFSSGSDIKTMKLERHETKEDVLVATVNMTTGVIWRRGSLRIPGVILPETIRIAAKGKLIEEIVEGSPFTGFKVISLIQDGSGSSAKLRITCTAQVTGPITLNINEAQELTCDTIVEALAPYIDLNVDAVAERTLRLMGREAALAALLNIVNGNSVYTEKAPFKYGKLIEGQPGPHLAIPVASHTGAIELFVRKAGIRSSTMVYIPGYNVAFQYDKGVANVRLTSIGTDHSPLRPTGFLGRLANALAAPAKSVPFEPTVKGILGFEAPNARIVKVRKTDKQGITPYVFENDCTIGKLINELK